MVIHDLPLVTTIAAGFCTAFVFGLIASKLRMSPIVGYLLAGILIGPFTPGYVANTKIAEELSEIGILLLMFGVGLHFSIRDLMQVKRIAVPGAIVQISVAMAMGVGVSYLWNWSLATGLMLGLALSVASTVVLLRALEEHNLVQTNNGKIAIGWLIVEDLVMVLALVMIPVLATVDITNGGMQEVALQVVLAVCKVTVFVVLMLVAGRRLLPWLLMTVADTRSRELFTLCVFAVAMGVAFGAAKLFGVSFALGAFFAGMMIRESDLSKEAAEKALPLQDAFAVLFFVAVGMLFNPAIIIEEPLKVLAVVAIIIVGKSIAAMAIILLMRYPLKTALVVSVGLAQIGEFSFILANLGVMYNIIPESARDLILAGAIISISLNPALFHASAIFHKFTGSNIRLAKLFRVTGDELSHLSRSEKRTLKELVIMVGHGRVGQYVSDNIHKASIDLVIVDANRERVTALRERGLHAIAGDATHESTLREANIRRAVALIVAVPNPFEARRIVETARGLMPDIKVIVRAQDDDEMDYFAAQKVDLAVMGPREVGRRMVEYLGRMRRKHLS